MAIPPQSLSGPEQRRPWLTMRWYSWLLLAGVATYGLAVIMHWDDRGALWVLERFQSEAQRKQAVWLPDYRAVIDAKPLPGMEKDEASDLTYNPQSKTLFAVMGKNPFLVELSLDGDVLRKLPLVGWSNPEGVAALPDGRLAIVDEREHKVTFVSVDASTRELKAAEFAHYDLGPSKEKNKAFEAVAWDPRGQQLLFGEERPATMFGWKSNGGSVLLGEKQRLPNDTLDMRNLSAIGIDPRTGHRLVLSADSHLLMELDATGKQISFISLLAGFNGLKNTIPRAEGVAMDENGTLYIVSEPNLFYAFRKADAG